MRVSGGWQGDYEGGDEDEAGPSAPAEDDAADGEKKPEEEAPPSPDKDRKKKKGGGIHIHLPKVRIPSFKRDKKPAVEKKSPESPDVQVEETEIKVGEGVFVEEPEVKAEAPEVEGQ